MTAAEASEMKCETSWKHCLLLIPEETHFCIPYLEILLKQRKVEQEFHPWTCMAVSWLFDPEVT